MALKSSDRVLWSITGVVATALAVVTVLLFQQAGAWDRWREAVRERSDRAAVSVIPGEEDVPLIEETVDDDQQVALPTDTPVPVAPQRIFFIAADQGATEENLAEHIRLWAIPATGGEAEMVADEVRAHGFGETPPWCLIPSEDDPHLTFVQGPTEGMRLMLLDLGTGEFEELYAASDGEWIGSPSASPDGQRLAFITAEPPPGGEFHDDVQATLHVATIADGEVEREFEPVTIWTPLAWSADSHWLAAVESGGPLRWPRMLLFPAGEGEMLEPPFSRGLQASWAPEGQRLVAVRGRSAGGVELISWDVAAGEHEPLALAGQEAGQPPGVVWAIKWSPDGEWLAGLAGDDWPAVGLYVVGQESAEPVALYGEGEDEGAVWWYEWSPDARHIAFIAARSVRPEGAADEGATGEVGGFVMQPDGDGSWQVATGLVGRVEAMAWSPDGQQLAFGLHMEGDDGQASSRLYVADIGEQRPTLLHEGVGNVLYLRWVPAVGGG